MKSVILAGALGGEVTAMSVINRVEQLGWIPLADEWLELRRIRNIFAHDYLENPELHPVRLLKAMAAGRGLMEILGAIARGTQNSWHGG